MQFLDGYKSYIAAGGFLLLALYELASGNVGQAMQHLLAAISILGIRHAIQKTEVKQ